MKLNKLLTPILSLATVSTIVAPIATGCTSQEKHVWFSSVDEAKKDADGNYSANYYFGLDKDTYETKDIDVVITSNNRNDIKLSHFVSAQVLVVNVIYAKELDEPTTIVFDLKIWTSEWTSNIQWLKLNISEITEKERTMEEWLDRYEKVRNHFLAEEQDPTKYTTFDLAVGDYSIYNEGGTIKKTVVTKDSKQKNTLVVKKSESSQKYDSLVNSFVIDGESFSLDGAEYDYELDRAGKKQQLLGEEEWNVIHKYFLPKDGSLVLSTELEDEHSYEYYYQLFDSNGYLKEFKIISIMSTADLEISMEQHCHISNYRKA